MEPRLPSLEPKTFEFARRAARPSDVNAPRRLSSKEFLVVAGLRTGVCATEAACSAAAAYAAALRSVLVLIGEGEPAGTS